MIDSYGEYHSGLLKDKIFLLLPVYTVSCSNLKIGLVWFMVLNATFNKSWSQDGLV
jgi:hypothetical protein